MTGARRLGFFAVGLLLALYALAFLRLYPVAGEPAIALFLFPASAAAWYFGLRGGLVVSLAGGPLHLALGLVTGAPFNAFAFGFGVAAALAFGWARDLHARVREQARELERERDARARQGSLRESVETLAQRRARQVGFVAELGQAALQGLPLGDLQRRATHAAAEGLDTDFADLLEYVPGAERFVFRGIHGANEDLLGRTLTAGKGSHSGYTMLVGQPVVVSDYASDARFNIPIASKQYRLASGLCVLVGDPMGQPWGTLSVYTKTRRSFTADDVSYLQAVANVLGFALAARNAEDARRSLEPLGAIGVVALSAADEIVSGLDASSSARVVEAARRIRRAAVAAPASVADVDRAVEEALALAVARGASDVVARLGATRPVAMGRGELAQLVVDLVTGATGGSVSVRTSDEGERVALEVVSSGSIRVPAAARVAESKGARLVVANEPGRASVKVLLKGAA